MNSIYLQDLKCMYCKYVQYNSMLVYIQYMYRICLMYSIVLYRSSVNVCTIYVCMYICACIYKGLGLVRVCVCNSIFALVQVTRLNFKA